MNSQDIAYKLHQDLLEEPLIKEYQYLESQIKNHPELFELEKDIKDMQKALLKSKLENNDDSLFEEYNKKKEYYLNHPLINNYINIKEEVNNYLHEIEHYINEKLL